MKDKIKVFFIIPTLFAGGAERVMSFLSQNLDKKKFNVTLIVIGFEKDKKFEITEVPVVFLNKDRISNALLLILSVLRQQKPQVVLSSIAHLNIMMGLISIFFPNIKFIGRHTTISNIAKNFKENKNKFSIYSFLKLDSFAMKNLDIILCQSSDMKEDILQVYDIEKSKIKIIHNPITVVSSLKKDNLDNNGVKRYITIGRLSEIKGQLRILDVLSKLTVPFEYTIIGDGSHRELIQKKINDLHLKDKVKIIKFTEDVFSYLVKNDLFLQGSYSEGFPNALLESCSAGVPILAFKAPGGTKDIIINNLNGFLVNNEKEFLEKLQESFDWNPKQIRESVYKKFNKEKIIKEYEELIIDLNNNKK